MAGKRNQRPSFLHRAVATREPMTDAEVFAFVDEPTQREANAFTRMIGKALGIDTQGRIDGEGRGNDDRRRINHCH